MANHTNITQREAGVLLHVTSLPRGDIGPDAYHFVDTLVEMGCSIWQTLPVNMPHGDRSPYQSVSAHAGDVALISLDLLHEQGWCNKTELKEDKKVALHAAFQRFINQQPLLRLQSHGLEMQAFLSFCQVHAHWLDDFALFMVLCEQFGAQSWQHWPEAYRKHDTITLQALGKSHAQALIEIKFHQYVFFAQWQALKNYANQHGVQLFGDIPIFVAYDSSDVWAHPHWFKLDASLAMTVVAGVPPDYFSATGQRWGNPHYHWPAMLADGLSWWLSRVSVQSDLFDLLRIDHFRGLQAAWEIPANEPTAMNGSWVEAPGDILLAALQQHFPQLQLIAEDLGIITSEVDALRQKYLLPGMKILQFAFNGDASNPYLPSNIELNSVAYTGTHDNDTSLGWYRALDAQSLSCLNDYLNTDKPTMPQALIDVTLQSVARLAIVPMQDILGLGSEARFNVPGTAEGNWMWQMKWTQLSKKLLGQFKQAVIDSGRAKA